MATKSSLTLPESTYNIQYEISSFNHLCTFQEFSNFKITKVTKDTQFDTEKVQNKDFTERDYLIFRKVLIESLENSHKFLKSKKGILYTCGTGNRASWDYVAFNALVYPPFMELLPQTSFPLYTTTPGGTSVVKGTEDEDPVETLTMFIIDTKALFKVSCEETNKYIEEQLALVPPPTPEYLTKEAVLTYLRNA